MNSPFNAPFSWLKRKLTFVFHCKKQLFPKSSGISKHITLLRCESPKESTVSLPPLVMIMTWLSAHEKHVDKYRQLYLSRGFDIAIVRTSPIEALFPAFGTKKIAIECVDALKNQLFQYKTVIIHSFSVGCYQISEMLPEMEKEQKIRNRVDQRVAGLIMDSSVTLETYSIGLARSMSSNPFIYKTVKALVDAYMTTVGYFFTTKYFIRGSENMWNNYLKVPAVFFLSEDDPFCSFSENKSMAESWRSRGIDVIWRCWPKSQHVQHYRHHPEEYEEAIDQLLAKIREKNNL